MARNAHCRIVPQIAQKPHFHRDKASDEFETAIPTMRSGLTLGSKGRKAAYLRVCTRRRCSNRTNLTFACERLCRAKDGPLRNDLTFVPEWMPEPPRVKSSLCLSHRGDPDEHLFSVAPLVEESLPKDSS
jgi:hypothetical protein